MSLKTAQLIIIAQLFNRHDGRRQSHRARSQVDAAPQVAPANVARQAWRQLKLQGLIDDRGRLTLAGLAVAVALRSRARRATREAVSSRKSAVTTCSASLGLLLAA